jgi:hypothetical protein
VSDVNNLLHLRGNYFPPSWRWKRQTCEQLFFSRDRIALSDQNPGPGFFACRLALRLVSSISQGELMDHIGMQERNSPEERREDPTVVLVDSVIVDH